MNELYKTKSLFELSYNKRTVTPKDVQQQDEWKFERKIGEGTDLPVCVIVKFQQRDLLDNQFRANGSLFSPAIIAFAQCIFGTEQNLVAGIFLQHTQYKLSLGFIQNVFCFTHPTKYDILQPYHNRTLYVVMLSLFILI